LGPAKVSSALRVFRRDIADGASFVMFDALRLSPRVPDLWLEFSFTLAEMAALANALRLNSSLVDLRLCADRNSDKSGLSMHMGTSAILLADVLRFANTTLQRLSLVRCNIDEIGAAALAAMLHTNRSLRHLAFFGNRIGDLGVSCICSALCKNSALTTLHVCDDTLGVASAPVVIELMGQNTTLFDVCVCDGHAELRELFESRSELLESAAFKLRFRLTLEID
jgi:hypothetical protein